METFERYIWRCTSYRLGSKLSTSLPMYRIQVKPKLKVTLTKRKESLSKLAAVLSETILEARHSPNFISNIFN